MSIDTLDAKCYLGLAADAINTIVAMHEVRGKLWVRNGHNIRYLVSIYRAAKFCSHTFDMDMHSLQLAFSFCGKNADFPDFDTMLVLLGSRCRVMELLSLRDLDPSKGQFEKIVFLFKIKLLKFFVALFVFCISKFDF